VSGVVVFARFINGTCEHEGIGRSVDRSVRRPKPPGMATQPLAFAFFGLIRPLNLITVGILGCRVCTMSSIGSRKWTRLAF
jgi:hypothetical protein